MSGGRISAGSFSYAKQDRTFGTATTRYTSKSSEQLRIEFVCQPTGALNKIRFMTSIYLLHVTGAGVPSSGSLSDQRHTIPTR